MRAQFKRTSRWLSSALTKTMAGVILAALIVLMIISQYLNAAAIGRYADVARQMGRSADIYFAGELQALSDLMAAVNVSHTPEEMLSRLTAAVEPGGYVRLVLTHSNGTILCTDRLLPSDEDKYILQTAARQQSYTSPPMLDYKTGQMVVAFAATTQDASGATQTLAGIKRERVVSANLLDPSFGRLGEYHIVNRQGQIMIHGANETSCYLRTYDGDFPLAAMADGLFTNGGDSTRFTHVVRTGVPSLERPDVAPIELEVGTAFLAWVPLPSAMTTMLISRPLDTVYQSSTAVLLLTILLIVLFFLFYVAAMLFGQRIRLQTDRQIAAEKRIFDHAARTTGDLMILTDYRNQTNEAYINSRNSALSGRLALNLDAKPDDSKFYLKTFPDHLDMTRSEPQQREQQDDQIVTRLNKVCFISPVDGEAIWLRCWHVQYVDDWERSVYSLVMVSDITGEVEHEHTLKAQATQDGLTGVMLKAPFIQRVQHILALEERALHAFLVLDIDNFKGVNDTYGHAFGDQLLKMVGHITLDSFRADDTVGRIGGDEFGVMMVAVGDESIVRARLDRLLSTLHLEGYTDEGKHYDCTVSIGAVIFSPSGYRYEDILEAADRAMYGAKHHGKNTYNIHWLTGQTAHGSGPSESNEES